MLEQALLGASSRAPALDVTALLDLAAPRAYYLCTLLPSTVRRQITTLGSVRARPTAVATAHQTAFSNSSTVSTARSWRKVRSNTGWSSRRRDCFSIHDLAAQPDQTTCWSGVRNFQARNLMRDRMKRGDRVLFHHSGGEPPAVAGTAVVVREAYPDPTAWDPADQHYDPKSSPDNPIWQMVDIRLDSIFAEPLSLAELRALPELKNMELLRKGSRLSVQPVSKLEFDAILKLAHARRHRPNRAAGRDAPSQRPGHWLQPAPHAIDPLAWIAAELAELERRELRRRLSERAGPQGPLVQDGLRRLVNFASNDYLNLAADPRLCAAAQEAGRAEGWGAGASPLISGHSHAHADLERRLAAWLRTEAALLFASGYAANCGTIAALVGRGDAVFGDAKNHASLIDGCRLSRAEVFVYPHGDLARAERTVMRGSRGSAAG